MSYLMGIDIGTSSTKAILIDEEGNLIGSAICEYPLYQEKIGWAEQDPEDWWKATCKVTKEIITKTNAKPSDIKGIGLSGQMHGAVLLDSKNNVLRHAIIWCDQRSSKECEEITDLIGKERLIKITANPALTGFTAAKVMWVKNNEKHVFEKIKKILLPKDYIRFKLTGEFATEVSDASGMQFMDIPGRKWSNEVIEKLGFDKDMFARLYESPEVTGRITKEASMQTGLKEGTIVVGGAGDQAAGAIGNGIVKTGIVSSTIGTSGVVFAYSDNVIIDNKGRVHTFCHAVPGKYHVMGVTQGAGLSLKWFRDNFCSEEKAVAELLHIDPYEILNKEASLSKLGSNGLIFLPYLMGERTPHTDPHARGVFFGISAKHNKKDMLRAIMEGVVFSLMDCLEIIEGMSIKVTEVRASGGGAKSELWRQIQSDVFNKNIWVVEGGEGPALGVAILAGVGAGIYKSVPEGCETVVKATRTNSPVEENHKKYMEFYKIYRSLYPALKELFFEIWRLS